LKIFLVSSASAPYSFFSESMRMMSERGMFAVARTPMCVMKKWMLLLIWLFLPSATV
jgi:hypothetical protein